jgi:hypothetical protein
MGSWRLRGGPLKTSNLLRARHDGRLHNTSLLTNGRDTAGQRERVVPAAAAVPLTATWVSLEPVVVTMNELRLLCLCRQPECRSRVSGVKSSRILHLAAMAPSNAITPFRARFAYGLELLSNQLTGDRPGIHASECNGSQSSAL